MNQEIKSESAMDHSAKHEPDLPSPNHADDAEDLYTLG